MNDPRKSREATRGGLTAGDLSSAEGTGKSLVQSRLTSGFDALSKRCWLAIRLGCGFELDQLLRQRGDIRKAQHCAVVFGWFFRSQRGLA